MKKIIICLMLLIVIVLSGCRYEVDKCETDDDCSIKYQIWNGEFCEAGCYNDKVEPDLKNCGDVVFEQLSGTCKCVDNQCVPVYESK